MDAAKVILENYDSLVREAIYIVSRDYPNFQDPRGFQVELTRFLRVIQYCLVVGGTGPLDELLIAGQREVFSALGIPREPYIAAMSYMRNSSPITQAMAPLARAEFVRYIDYLIASLA